MRGSVNGCGFIEGALAFGVSSCVFNVYSRAEVDGSGALTVSPRRLFARTIQL